MATILYNADGQEVRVEKASRVAAMLENGFTVEAPEVSEQEELDFVGGAQGTDSDDDGLDIDIDGDGKADVNVKVSEPKGKGKGK